MVIRASRCQVLRSVCYRSIRRTLRLAMLLLDGAMIISHQHRFIFVKTLKTAGTSIEVFLSGLCGRDDVVTPFTSRNRGMRHATFEVFTTICLRPGSNMRSAPPCATITLPSVSSKTPGIRRYRISGSCAACRISQRIGALSSTFMKANSRCPQGRL